MDPLRIATRRIFLENIFYIFEFYLNGKTKFYEIKLELLENFFILLRIFSKPKMYVLNYFAPLMSRLCFKKIEIMIMISYNILQKRLIFQKKKILKMFSGKYAMLLYVAGPYIGFQ